MEGLKAPGRFLQRSRLALMLALSALGLSLITSALHYPVTSPALPSPSPRQATAAASARGASASGRQWLAFERRTLAREAPLSETSWRPASASLGTGGPAEGDEATAPTAAAPRTEVIVYTVQPGDYVQEIARRFGISQDTVIWANDRLELDPDLLSVGEELNILPVTGVWHTVKAGETLAGIAQRYQVTPQQIINYLPNGLTASARLVPGQKLIIPDGVKPFEPRLVQTEAGAVTVNARPELGRFIWPCSGAITTPFGPQHLAIDIANRAGTPIYAAAAGTVTLAGPHGTLGNTVRIEHGDGYVTVYGHLQTILVQLGQRVQQGQQIGEMGSTGHSTGPHVHFMINYYGGAVNPVRYLPRQ